MSSINIIINLRDGKEAGYTHQGPSSESLPLLVKIAVEKAMLAYPDYTSMVITIVGKLKL